MVNGRKEITELSKRIKQAREEAHLSQMALAKGIGVSDKAISSYEQGRSMPPVEKLKKIAQQTRRPVNYFTNENIEEVAIVAKLMNVERELAEIKRLLQKSSK